MDKNEPDEIVAITLATLNVIGGIALAVFFFTTLHSIDAHLEKIACTVTAQTIEEANDCRAVNR